MKEAHLRAHPRESLIDLIEAGVDLTKARVDLIEACVDLTKARVDLIEACVRLLPKRRQFTGELLQLTDCVLESRNAFLPCSNCHCASVLTRSEARAWS